MKALYSFLDHSQVVHNLPDRYGLVHSDRIDVTTGGWITHQVCAPEERRAYCISYFIRELEEWYMLELSKTQVEAVRAADAPQDWQAVKPIMFEKVPAEIREAAERFADFWISVKDEMMERLIDQLSQRLKSNGDRSTSHAQEPNLVHGPTKVDLSDYGPRVVHRKEEIALLEQERRVYQSRRDKARQRCADEQKRLISKEGPKVGDPDGPPVLHGKNGLSKVELNALDKLRRIRMSRESFRLLKKLTRLQEESQQAPYTTVFTARMGKKLSHLRTRAKAWAAVPKEQKELLEMLYPSKRNDSLTVEPSTKIYDPLHYDERSPEEKALIDAAREKRVRKLKKLGEKLQKKDRASDRSTQQVLMRLKKAVKTAGRKARQLYDGLWSDHNLALYSLMSPLTLGWLDFNHDQMPKHLRMPMDVLTRWAETNDYIRKDAERGRNPFWEMNWKEQASGLMPAYEFIPRPTSSWAIHTAKQDLLRKFGTLPLTINSHMWVQKKADRLIEEAKPNPLDRTRILITYEDFFFYCLSQAKKLHQRNPRRNMSDVIVDVAQYLCSGMHSALYQWTTGHRVERVKKEGLSQWWRYSKEQEAQRDKDWEAHRGTYRVVLSPDGSPIMGPCRTFEQLYTRPKGQKPPVKKNGEVLEDRWSEAEWLAYAEQLQPIPFPYLKNDEAEGLGYARRFLLMSGATIYELTQELYGKPPKVVVVQRDGSTAWLKRKSRKEEGAQSIYGKHANASIFGESELTKKRQTVWEEHTSTIMDADGQMRRTVRSYSLSQVRRTDDGIEIDGLITDKEIKARRATSGKDWFSDPAAIAERKDSVRALRCASFQGWLVENLSHKDYEEIILYGLGTLPRERSKNVLRTLRKIRKHPMFDQAEFHTNLKVAFTPPKAE